MSVYQFDAVKLDVALLDGAALGLPEGSNNEITFNFYGLQNSNIVTRFVKISAPSLDLQKRAYPRAQGMYAETAYWRETRIVLRGTVKGSTRADMETRMDEMRKNLAVFGGVLKIPWAGTFRYYECYAIGLDKIFQERDHFHMTMCPFEVELVALQPFGRTSWHTVTDVPNPVVVSPTTIEFVNAGTAESDSVAYLTIVTAGSLSQIVWENTTNGDKVTVASSFVNGDQIIIDGENRRVTKNSVEIDYTGVLPKLVTGSNIFKITLTGAGFSLSVTEIHYPRFY